MCRPARIPITRKKAFKSFMAHNAQESGYAKTGIAAFNLKCMEKQERTAYEIADTGFWRNRDR